MKKEKTLRIILLALLVIDVVLFWYVITHNTKEWMTTLPFLLGGIIVYVTIRLQPKS